MEAYRPFGMEEIYPNSYCESNTSRTDKPTENPLSKEIGGNHYKGNYQPVELIEKVGMYFCCGNVLKYVYRHKNKNGRQDLEEALHYCELMSQLGNNWYSGTPISMDYSRYEFYKFITENKQLDANQMRAILSIANKDISSLKEAISNEILCCYENDL